MTHRQLWIIPLIAAAVVVPVATATLADPDDDDEERAFQRAQAKQSWVENCLMCHGEDMTTRQRLTPRQWSAEVEKMVNWGSPLPTDRKQPLIDYLAEAFPNTQAAPPPERITPDSALALDQQPRPTSIPVADLGRGESLFATHCASCHGPIAKGGDLGTNLVEKPVLLRDDEFRTLLKDGRRRMPGFAAVLDDRGQTDLLAWLRSRPGR
jgi:ubiquinol-cytochrome c reductase cytochrome c subunit